MNLEYRQITVKKGEWPLDYLAELAKEGKKAWVFFDKHIVDSLMQQAGYKTACENLIFIGVTERLGAKQNADLHLYKMIESEKEEWGCAEVLLASAQDVEFKSVKGEFPEVILTLTMED